MPLTVALSGPERTRAACELALEDADIPIVPDDHYSLMNWPSKLPANPVEKSRAKHGLISVQVRDADQLNQTVKVVEPHDWVLRVHYETPPPPEPSPEQVMAATIQDMRAEIDALKAKMGA